ncbi:MAG: peptide ABC transporter substrate-binding protein [Desulfobacterales bacterium]|nr:peptide ABC transporter substrate-binding protein [Desulfobacterales bacterium]
MKKKKVSIIVGCLLVFMLVFSSATSAETVLRVGWQVDEMLKSLVCSESWQYSTMGCVFWPIVYDQAWLLDKPPGYGFVMRAAEKIETDDNIHYRYTIRDNMTFHDGKPVTARDVAFTYENLRESDPVWDYPDTHAVKDSFVIVDERTFEFELDHTHGGKYPPFNWQPILPEHIWSPYKKNMLEYANEKAIGSGPFKLAEFKPGQYIVMEKHEGYWDKRPRVDKVVFKSYGSIDAQNMAVKRGEIDMDGYTGISPLAMKNFKDAKDVELIVNPGIALDWLTFNMFMEERGVHELVVRQAIVHAIDKQRIIKLIFNNQATEQDGFIYPELSHYNTEIPQYAYDVALSNKLLDDAGFVDTDGDGIRNYKGENMEYRLLAFSTNIEIVKMGQMIREMVKPIGIDIVVNSVDLDTYYDIYYTPAEKRFEMAFGAEEPGPYADWIWEFMRSYDNGGEGWNTSGYNNAEFDKVLDAYTTATSVEERNELSKKMQMIMATDLPYYVIVRPNVINAVRIDKLQGYVSTMGGISNWINPWTFFEVHAK